MTPQQVAAAENRAARLSWGELPVPDGRTDKKNTVAERVRPFLSSGLSSSEIARRIGCTKRSVNYALKKIGGSP